MAICSSSFDENQIWPRFFLSYFSCDPRFKREAVKSFTEVNFQIGLTLANQAVKSTWNEGGFFDEIFANL
jgi:hypothetical protein